MLPIWRNSSFPNSLQVHIFKSNVVSVLLYGSSTWKVIKSIITKLQVFVNRCLRSIFHSFGPIVYLTGSCWKWRICSRLMWSLEDINGAGLGIPCEKMSLQWPDKLCNGILWMVLGEERGNIETNCGKGMQESKQNLVWFETTGSVKSSVESWRCWCPDRDQGN